MRQGVSAGQYCDREPDEELLELLDELLLLELLLEELLLELLLELLDDELLDDELLGAVVPPPQADKRAASARARLPPRKRRVVNMALVPVAIRCDDARVNFESRRGAGKPEVF